MRVCVYEYMTAQGLGSSPTSPLHGMYLEGRAMYEAVIADFKQIPGVDVVTFHDHNLPVGRHAFLDAARTSDWTLVVAPETVGILASLAEDVVTAGGALLGPTPEAIHLASDKLALATHWRERGVPTPATTDRQPTPCEAFPVVWKPRDGAGSTNTFLLTSAVDVLRATALAGRRNAPEAMILQEFVPGLAASIAFLCGPAGYLALPPALQLLSSEGDFHYLGGELPVHPHQLERATEIGQRAVECVPGLSGYVGVDLVLGDREDGSRDYAIEINPRLTTSYVGYRALAEFNLAEYMVQIASGRPAPKMTWRPGRIRFSAEGVIGPP